MKDVEIQTRTSNCSTISALEEAELSHLPAPIAKYLEACGYLSAPLSPKLVIRYRNVSFVQSKGSKPLTIDYTQCNFAEHPARLAFIQSRVFGVPFEGYDAYLNGKGCMKGVISKLFTLFEQEGPEMDQACLVTYLSECLFIPASLRNGCIAFKDIDDLHVEATIEYRGVKASGLFSFNDQHEMISFVTTDRAAIANDGAVSYVPWSAKCSDYITFDDGIRRPTQLSATWHYDDEDFTYFSGRIDSYC